MQALHISERKRGRSASPPTPHKRHADARVRLCETRGAVLLTPDAHVLHAAGVRPDDVFAVLAEHGAGVLVVVDASPPAVVYLRVFVARCARADFKRHAEDAFETFFGASAWFSARHMDDTRVCYMRAADMKHGEK